MSSSAQTVVLLVGAVLITAAIGWRSLRYGRVRRGIRRGLADADPVVRTAAVQQAAELGLSTTAAGLLRAVRVESDSAVLAVVVEAIASRQWEPASTSAVVELRLWAKAYSDVRPELHRPRTEREPMLAGVPGTVLPPSLHPLREREFRRRASTDLEYAHANEPAVLGGPPDLDPLASTRVLVTGAGGAAGVAVIRSLRSAGHHVIAVDADPMAVGLHLANVGYPVPRYDDPTYLAAIIRLATVTDSQALICTVAEEYFALAPSVEYLEEAGIRTMMPSVETVRTCIDKWLFAQAMNDAGVPVPATHLGDATDVPGPWIVKPRFGRGSRDVHAAQSAADLRAAIALTPEPIVQTRVAGREFTVDALACPGGGTVAVSPRWRLATKAGISTLGTTFEDDDVAAVTRLVLKAVGHVGPANVQGFKTDDDEVVVVEMNPRFSGGLPLSLAAGFDVVGEYLRLMMGREVRADRLVARPDLTMYRYFDEVYR